MSFSAFREMKPSSQLMFSIFVILVSFMVFMFVSVMAAVPFFGMNALTDITGISDFNNPESLRILKYMQVMQSIGLFILPPFILAWLYHGNPEKYLLLDKKISSASIVYVIILVFFSLPLINFLGEINNQMVFPEWLSGLENWMKDAEERAAELTDAFLKVHSMGGLLFNLFMIAFLPAIGEELLFRGVIQRIFTEWTRNHHWGIWISAILFSALHIQFYGFIPRLLLGVMFGYLLVWSGSIWLPILAHFFNNAFAVTAMYLIDKNILDPEMEHIGSDAGSYYATALSIVLIILIIWLIRKDNPGKEPDYLPG